MLCVYEAFACLHLRQSQQNTDVLFTLASTIRIYGKHHLSADCASLEIMQEYSKTLTDFNGSQLNR